MRVLRLAAGGEPDAVLHCFDVHLSEVRKEVCVVLEHVAPELQDVQDFIPYLLESDYLFGRAGVEHAVDLLQELFVVEHVVDVLVADASQVLDQLQSEELRPRVFVSQPFFDDRDALFGAAQANPTRTVERSCRARGP